nr:hypothetical protein BdHM001_35070 [Bdellovibrio sp. HM001]
MFRSPEEAKLWVVIDFSYVAYRIYHSKNTKPKKDLFFDLITSFLEPFRGHELCLIFALDDEWLAKKAVDPQYKANRQKLPINPKSEYLPFIGMFPSYIARAYAEEADDVIATMVYSNKGDKKIAVITTDSDMGPMTTHPHTLLINARTGEPFGANGELNKFNVKAPLISLYKAVFGDQGDNVKAVVKGLRRAHYEVLICGSQGDDKRFLKLFIEELRLKRKIKTDAEEAELRKRFYKNLELVMLKKDVNVEIVPASQEPDLEEVYPLWK